MLSAYELERERRLAENKMKLESLKVLEVRATLEQTVATVSRRVMPMNARRQAPRKKTANSTGRKVIEKRQSLRIRGNAPKNYNEAALSLADSKTTAKRSKSTRSQRLGPYTEEIYKQADVALLGDYSQPWIKWRVKIASQLETLNHTGPSDMEDLKHEIYKSNREKGWPLFKDGYVDGVRVYDKVNGMTCHQCRQKTLGRHTSCSRCKTLQGVFCGDCLFMRYGENILEVAARDHWVCPPCRNLCNCSVHRNERGWAPTGSMYRKAIREGYRSVAHYLVLTKLDPAEGAQKTTPEPPPQQSAKPVSASRGKADQAGREGSSPKAPGQTRRRAQRDTAAPSDEKSKAGAVPSGPDTKGRKRAREPTSRSVEEAKKTVQARGIRAKSVLEPEAVSKRKDAVKKRAQPTKVSQFFRQSTRPQTRAKFRAPPS